MLLFFDLRRVSLAAANRLIDIDREGAAQGNNLLLNLFDGCLVVDVVQYITHPMSYLHGLLVFKAPSRHGGRANAQSAGNKR